MTTSVKDTKQQTQVIDVLIARLAGGNFLKAMSGKPPHENERLASVTFERLEIDGIPVPKEDVVFTTTSVPHAQRHDCRLAVLTRTSNKDQGVSIHVNMTTGDYTASNAWTIPTTNARVRVFFRVSRLYEPDVEPAQEIPNEVYHAEEAALKLATHRHYKGGLYRKLYDSNHSEDKDAEGNPVKYVVYEHLFPHEPGIWVRPAELFYGNLEDGSRRFRPLTDRGQKQESK